MNTIENLMAAVGIVVIVGACGAAFTYGMALVCLRIGWSPINLTVHVHNNIDPL